jgi:5-methylcytosine-specific restriction endonuclease McrA
MDSAKAQKGIGPLKPGRALGLPCADCATTESGLLYRSGRMTRCYDCQNYWNLIHKKVARQMEFDRTAFVAWKRENSDRRSCQYCGIDAASLYRLEITRANRRCENIGVDRIDNQEPYRLANLVPCCPICNGIKSDVLTYAEMVEVGNLLGRLWRRRLAAVDPAAASDARRIAA